MPGNKNHRLKQIDQFLFSYLSEILTLSGLCLLLIVSVYPWYERGQIRLMIASSFQNLDAVVEALLVYSSEHPKTGVFPPGLYSDQEGIALCPLVKPSIQGLSFLTTPTAYLNSVPIDPFLSEIFSDPDVVPPFVLHWIKRQSNTDQPYTHLAWGSFSIGPSLDLPPQYSFPIFKAVLYESKYLRMNLYHPSNGLHSIGLIYNDSLGNHSPFLGR